ncbi:HAD family hydrolase [Lysobacter sp. HDW10]|uniref:HAD family hydrolase n=1 Tax=Lysobacter sp. HDW10 TaxID=2714936 RepID=UPI00140E939D|nr:HAD family hydrolase [Lysobacter sp. HDW10]QIK80472.1 HAD family hydrolase [Lysobacter sp. HDW10]
MSKIALIGFDADDTLWKSEDYFREAEATFLEIVGRYEDVSASAQALYAIQSRNIALFGYGVKGMVLSMIEAAVEFTNARISAKDIHRIVEIGKAMLDHPVELLPGISDAVRQVAESYPLVLITKGDLFHQERKVAVSGLTEVFQRIEIVSEKNEASYERLFKEFAVDPAEFLMVGNSLRSDIAPVIELGGMGIHVPYHVTWVHEHAEISAGIERFRTAHSAADIPAMIQALAESPTP